MLNDHSNPYTESTIYRYFLILSYLAKPVQIEISFSYSIQFDFYQRQIANDIEKKSAKSCKTGVILVLLVIWYFTVLPCSSSSG